MIEVAIRQELRRIVEASDFGGVFVMAGKSKNGDLWAKADLLNCDFQTSVENSNNSTATGIVKFSCFAERAAINSTKDPYLAARSIGAIREYIDSEKGAFNVRYGADLIDFGFLRLTAPKYQNNLVTPYHATLDYEFFYQR